MRRGYFGCAVLLDEQGEIFAIGTGSDACAEHEQGSRAMQEALCSGDTSQKSGMPKFLQWLSGKAAPVLATDNAIIQELRKGTKIQFPSLLARKHINQNLDKVQFVSGTEGGCPVAVWGYTPYGLPSDIMQNPELIGATVAGDTKLIVGAWDERSFALKVRGEALVQKLQRFAEKVQAGDGLFAGTFLDEKVTGSRTERLGGVIIAVLSGLGPQHLDSIQKAQRKWEDDLKLKAYSKEKELYALQQADKPHVRLPGFIWPVWKDKDSTEKNANSVILYEVNAELRHDVDRGPHTFDALKAWILAERKYPLHAEHRKG